MAWPVVVSTSNFQYAPWRAHLVRTTPNPAISKSAFRPPGWSGGGDPNVASPGTFIEDEYGTFWYFDAVLHLNHLQTQRVTQHPIQSGANISDHSYAMPAQLVMEIGMSDVMDSYVPGQWGTYSGKAFTKSALAYQQILDWKNNGAPLNITTRLDTYYNMVVASISAPDDSRTLHGLRCTVTFQQIFVAELKVIAPDSARSNVTVENQSGQISATPLNTFFFGDYDLAYLQGNLEKVSQLNPEAGTIVEDVQEAIDKLGGDFKITDLMEALEETSTVVPQVTEIQDIVSGFSSNFKQVMSAIEAIAVPPLTDFQNALKSISSILSDLSRGLLSGGTTTT